MEYYNFISSLKQEAVNETQSQKAIETLVILLAPFAPHLAEELWRQLGKSSLVSDEKWPRHDASALKEESVTLVVQINGVMRTTLSVPVGIAETAAVAQASGDEKVQRHLEKKTLVKTIYISNRLLNFVVK